MVLPENHFSRKTAPYPVPLDARLCARVEAVLRGLPSDLTEAQLNRRLAGYLPLLAHAAKVALSAPPLRRCGTPEGAGRPLEGARELFVTVLASIYIGLTGELPSASGKRGGFATFVRDIFWAVPLLAAAAGNPDAPAHPQRIVNPERCIKATVRRYREGGAKLGA